MSLVRVQSEEPDLKKPAFEQAFCFFVSVDIARRRYAFRAYDNLHINPQLLANMMLHHHQQRL